MNLVNEGVLPPNEPDDRDERREEMEIAQERETLADIVAEYRNDADAMDRGELYQPTTEYLRKLLDRIEAIDSADAWRSLYTPPVGDAAALRDALVALRDAARNFCHQILNSKYNDIMDEYKCRERGFPALLDLRYAIPKANAALSAPARNCDIYTTSKDAGRAITEYCSKMAETGECVKSCPHRKAEGGCAFGWLLAAAERKGEGDANN